MKLSELQVSTLRELVEFCLFAKGIDVIQIDRDTYYNSVATLFRSSSKNLRSHLFGSDRVLSSSDFEFFCTEFSSVLEKYVEELASDSNKSVKAAKVQEVQQLFKIWIESIHNKKNHELIRENKKILHGEDPAYKLQNTIWAVYEQSEEKVSIGILYLEEEEAGKFGIDTTYRRYLFDGTDQFFKGYSYPHKIDNLLIIHLYKTGKTNQESGLTVFVLKFDYSFKDPEICLGHKTFINQTDNNLKIKPILLYKTDESKPSSELISENMLAPLKMYFDSCVPLKFPKDPLFRFEDFQLYVTANLVAEKMPPPVFGSYYLYYRSSISKTINKSLLVLYVSFYGHLYAMFQKQNFSTSCWHGKSLEMEESSALKFVLAGPFKGKDNLNISFQRISQSTIGTNPITLFINFNRNITSNILTGTLVFDEGNGLNVYPILLAKRSEDTAFILTDGLEYDEEVIKKFLANYNEHSLLEYNNLFFKNWEDFINYNV